MKKKLIPLLIAGSVIITACDKDQANSSNSSAPAASATPAASSTVVNKADAVAEVNGHYISKADLADLEKEVASRSQGQTFPKDKLIDELVKRELLIQDALKKQLDKSDEVIAQIEDSKKTILTQADLLAFLKANPVSDAEIKAEYESKMGGKNALEYKARHILVKTEDEAKKIIAELDKGADFGKIANKDSLDAKDSQNGGDLGWFTAEQMVPDFSAAVEKLEKGKYSKTPVKTQFGYHIILREDSRQQTPPPLEAVKEQLMPVLQRKKVQQMLDNLRKDAKVEILVPLEDEKPKLAEPPAPPVSAKEAAPEAKAAEAAPEAKAAEPAKEAVPEAKAADTLKEAIPEAKAAEPAKGKK